VFRPLTGEIDYIVSTLGTNGGGTTGSGRRERAGKNTVKKRHVVRSPREINSRPVRISPTKVVPQCQERGGVRKVTQRALPNLKGKAESLGRLPSLPCKNTEGQGKGGMGKQELIEHPSLHRRKCSSKGKRRAKRRSRRYHPTLSFRGQVILARTAYSKGKELDSVPVRSLCHSSETAGSVRSSL